MQCAMQVDGRKTRWRAAQVRVRTHRACSWDPTVREGGARRGVGWGAVGGDEGVRWCPMVCDRCGDGAGERRRGLDEKKREGSAGKAAGGEGAPAEERAGPVARAQPGLERAVDDELDSEIESWRQGKCEHRGDIIGTERKRLLIVGW